MDGGEVLGGDGAEGGGGVGAFEFGDVVALAGEAFAGVVDEVGGGVEVVAPGAGVGEDEVASVAVGEEGEAFEGDGGEGEVFAVFDAPGFELCEGAEFGGLVGVWVDGVGEADFVSDFAAEEEAFVDFGEGGFGVGHPHKEVAEGEVGESVGVVCEVGV